MKQKHSRLAAVAAAAFVTGTAAAHHSDSLYFVDDRLADGGAIRVEGTVARVRWINPHSEFFIDVPSTSGGEPAQWAIETDSVNQLRALGWTEQTLAVGDKVIVVVSKSKFDDTAGRLRDMLVYDAAGGATIYLEYKKEGALWEAPLALYQKYTSCPGTKPYDPERQPGKETLLCNTLSAAELAAAKAEFGAKVLILRAK
jgi:uncharacterized protein DUF6152